MPSVDSFFPLLLLMLLTLFSAGVALDHDAERRRASRLTPDVRQRRHEAEEGAR